VGFTTVPALIGAVLTGCPDDERRTLIGRLVKPCRSAS
jgi:hypothetical protein